MLSALRLFAFVALTIVAHASANAEERVLLDKSGYIERSRERSVLRPEGLRQLEALRSKFSLSVHLVSMNLAALETGTIVFTLPDGVQYRFVGTKTDSTANGFPGYFNWSGRLANATDPTLRSATAIFSSDGTASGEFYGQVRIHARVFEVFGSVPGTYQALREADPKVRMQEAPSMSGR